MSAVKVYGFEGNPRTRAALVAAKYEGVDVEWVKVNPFAEGGVGADYLAKFPLGLVPALEKGDYKLTEALAIASYLAQENKSGLLGASKEDAADVLRWASWANADLLPSLAAWFRPLTGAAPYQKPAVEAAKAKAVKHLEYLEKTLASRTFLVGERVTLGDVFVASVLFRGFENVLDAEWRKANPNTVRYWQTVIHQQPFFEVLGKVEPTPVETAVVYTPPKKEAKPKAKHPCEALGKPSSFPLDDFKREYSNKDTPDAMKWLDEHFNANDYSVWRCDFKYNDELTLPFMSANQCTGFHTRLEASRKYLFGSLNVYGVANASKIIGVYLIRGNGTPRSLTLKGGESGRTDPPTGPADYKGVFDVAPDYESYNFTPLDYKTDREFIEKVWSWEGEVEGLTVADGKVFK
ncbi:elongation factor 1-gamma 1 [Rhodotorula diobovata]|uniref:Elongation factor 1-gamma 1 n=1 Tax=Rhodotorula diobovata TaxID=5288 RepID=A0A5C5FM33_9BASI|nr:elongation factor 1-gamma 1 [Rhodotorula diobovata]